jgi:hypothetical protein
VHSPAPRARKRLAALAAAVLLLALHPFFVNWVCCFGHGGARALLSLRVAERKKCLVQIRYVKEQREEPWACIFPSLAKRGHEINFMHL